MGRVKAAKKLAEAVGEGNLQLQACLAPVAHQEHSDAMNQTDVMIKILEMARVGGAMDPPEAIAYVSSLIDRLDMHGEGYEQEVRMLLRLGAAIWEMTPLDPEA